MNWTEQDLRNEFRTQEDDAPSAPAMRARLDATANPRRRTRAAWTTVIAAGIVTAAIPLMVAAPSGRPADERSSPVSTRDPAYGMTTAVPPTSCAVDALPLPAGHHVGSALAIDPSGRYILMVSAEAWQSSIETMPPPTADTRSTSLWVNGELRRLDVPGFAADVNSSGLVVGSGPAGPWILRDGHVTNLPGVAEGNANAINAAGAVAGSRQLSTSTPPFSQAVVWRSSDADAIDLPTPPGAWRSEAFDIDDDGTAVGEIEKEMPNRQAYVWFPDGTGRELLTPPGSGLINPGAVSIHNGWVAGFATTPAVGTEKPPMFVGMLWNLRTGEARVLPPVAAPKVNTHGWVVGANGDAGLVTDAGIVQLPDLSVQPPDLGMGTSARGLSDDGRMIVGEAKSKAVLWRCD